MRQLFERAVCLLKRQAGAHKQRPDLRLLFVCTANICRSPTAEGVMRKKLIAAGLQGHVEVASAGTHALRGSAADARAVRAAMARGCDLTALRARQFVTQDFSVFDHILVMDPGHIEWLQRQHPGQGPARVELLMRHARRHRGMDEVPDPYFGAPQGFEEALDLIEDACDGLLSALHAELRALQQRPRL